jgi:hypothetical protein
MLQTFNNWPNASIAVFCAVVLAISFLMGIATAPNNRTIPPTYISTSSQ